MARIIIPKHAGREFYVIESYAGTPLIRNGKTGKNKVQIPCRDWEQAKELCERLRTGNHDGEIWM
jgi:hypothetical protein